MDRCYYILLFLALGLMYGCQDTQSELFEDQCYFFFMPERCKSLATYAGCRNSYGEICFSTNTCRIYLYSDAALHEVDYSLTDMGLTMNNVDYTLNRPGDGRIDLKGPDDTIHLFKHSSDSESILRGVIDRGLEVPERTAAIEQIINSSMSAAFDWTLESIEEAMPASNR